jgi:transposase
MILNTLYKYFRTLVSYFYSCFYGTLNCTNWMAKSPKQLPAEGKLILDVELLKNPSADKRRIKAVLLHRFHRLTLNATAKKLNVSRRTVSEWIKRYDNYGVSGTRKSPRGHRRGVFPRGKVWLLRGAMDRSNLKTVAQVRDWLTKWSGVQVSQSAARYWRRLALKTSPQRPRLRSKATNSHGLAVQ